MRRVILGFVLITALPSFVSAADFVLPKTKKYTVSLINSLPECTAPSIQDDLSGAFACPYNPPASCQLTAEGWGTLELKRVGSLTKGTQDIAVKVKLKGLNATCEGLSLYPEFRLRIGGNRCAGGQPCVLSDFGMTLIGGSAGCVVVNGACNYTTALNANIDSDLFARGYLTQIEITKCGVREAVPLVSANLH